MVFCGANKFAPTDTVMSATEQEEDNVDTIEDC